MSLSSARDLKGTILALPLEERRELIAALLWSLPRDEVITLHKQIAESMQKDLIGCLPPELAMRVLGYLDPDELLLCKGVSRTWARLCDDQSLWRNLCGQHDPPIAPAPTTWHNLKLRRELLYAWPRQEAEYDEEYSDDEDDDYDNSYGGNASASFSTPAPVHAHPPGPGSASNPFTAGSPGSATSPRPSFLTQRFMGFLPGNSPSPLRTPASTTPTTNERPILSYLNCPSRLPEVDYKHLFLVRRILNWRMTDSGPDDMDDKSSPLEGKKGSGSARGKTSVKQLPAPLREPRVTILSPKSSSKSHYDSSKAAGGLQGHSQCIYSLHLFQHHMTLPWNGVDDPFTPGPDVFGTPPPLGMKLRSPSVAPASTLQGRDWLLSGSRDRTLRLWQLDSPSPRVVKVFSGGHTASILSHFVMEVPVGPNDVPTYIRRPGTPASPPEPAKRLLAVSGGSDGRICIWDIEHGDGSPEAIIEAHTDSVLFVRGNAQHIVSCSKDRTIRLFSTTTLEQLLLIPVLAEACNAVSLTRDFLVSASGDKTLRVWDIRDGRLLTKIEAHLRGVSALAFEEATPAAPARWRPEFPGAVLRGTVVTGSSDNGVRMFHIVQVPPGTPQSDLSFRDMLDLEHLAIDADGDADDDLGDRPHLIIRPAIDYEAPCTCDLRIGCKCWHKELVRSVFIGEQTVLSGSYDMTIKMWNRRTGDRIFDFKGYHTGRVYAITGDHKRVVSAGADERIVIIDFSDGLDTSFV